MTKIEIGIKNNKDIYISYKKLSKLSDLDLVDIIRKACGKINLETATRQDILQKDRAEAILIERYTPLICKIINTCVCGFSGNYTAGDGDDFQQEAIMGFLKGVRNFDTSKGTSIASYVRYYILNKVKNFANTANMRGVHYSQTQMDRTILKLKRKGLSAQQIYDILVEDGYSAHAVSESVQYICSRNQMFVEFGKTLDQNTEHACLSSYKQKTGETSIIEGERKSLLMSTLQEALKKYTPVVRKTWLQSRELGEFFSAEGTPKGVLNDQKIAEIWFENGVYAGGKFKDRPVSSETARLKLKQIDAEIGEILKKQVGEHYSVEYV